jgi:hypothetical protein
MSRRSIERFGEPSEAADGWGAILDDGEEVMLARHPRGAAARALQAQIDGPMNADRRPDERRSTAR